jgi:hypothetical protein
MEHLHENQSFAGADVTTRGDAEACSLQRFHEKAVKWEFGCTWFF